MRFEPLGQKMFSRRNWLLRCSILINIAVILYIGSQLMIGGGNNFANGGSFMLQEQQQPVVSALQMAAASQGPQQPPQQPPIAKHRDLAEIFEAEERLLANADATGAAAAAAEAAAAAAQAAAPQAPEIAPVIPANDSGGAPVVNDPSQVIGNIGAGGIGVPNAPNPELNNTQSDGYIVTGDEKELEERVRSLINCYDRDYHQQTLQRGDFWVLQNYVRAEHGEIKCHESITYTTHADYTFLDNLIPLLERWNAPVSIAMHAPGTDFQPTVDSIRYLRECLPGSHLVRAYTTFHIYFGTKHIPRAVPKPQDVFKTGYNCTLPAPYFNITSGHLYKAQKKLLYPVNVGRNIARDSALTHFILASDIELYPNPGLVKKFLEMIARNEQYLRRKAPRVFPLAIFEVEESSPVPHDKTELQEFLRTGKAIPFHKRVCASCHGVPKSKEWMSANETDELSVFHIGKRTGYYVHWEPIYIGTHADPHYDERLSWEGKSDKMPQGYALCVLDYEFHILDNAFLVHKPGIKVLKKDNRRAMLSGKTNQLIRKIIYPELKIMYGMRRGCAI
ncbi:beta-1,4-glucuronyltransferase 1 isoform X2 [Drosophila pseudoobscura]|nr:beta-1,4-glucuronyltransferase 1 isoform X2 [Drosophila pseudoobscura]XP_015035288.2 beta-1,4-glucuronyltransferase 1 isoform X2 [Drosophila pseudoobscura]XP_015035289.2 beta-1,4-glucuronyltransferase 1 isoform X2 [Drosophila pseudoobscura]XP_015035290.2 beta-1,4-glucuronyltransferase 1 isoform X2 [Drosophila pseudoobscura]XP_015035291.2 beta-1,4-glucuronyltransferase 1 isoform X2 [Drosophila pseudoobscura]XP_015035292.2 beta-1,4-glucuronyltransferase 1 isoform X2 [Drosophila pseudoobscura]